MSKFFAGLFTGEARENDLIIEGSTVFELELGIDHLLRSIPN
ncbi:hypothetical protein [Halobacillus dabanensis]|nr:hypothetical protein [Halobacillus dabanensis]